MHWVLVATVLMGLALLSSALWVWGVRRLYRPRALPPLRMTARCQDGWELAVHVRRAPERRFDEPVLLCHGLAANRYTFDFEPPYSVAHYLAEAGFDCFAVEWRGTGQSRKAPRGRRSTDFSVDDHIRQDGPALMDLALKETGAQRAFWLGHSLGGLVGYGVAQDPVQALKLKGLAVLGAPVFFKLEPFLRSLLGLGVMAAWPFQFRNDWSSAGLAPFLGYITLPLSDLVVNPLHVPPAIQRRVYANMMSSVSRKVLLQLQDWIGHDAFRSFDRQHDFRAGLQQLTLPVLVAGGSLDKLAPPECLQAQYSLLTSPDRTLHVFGKDRGDVMDYGHGDLMFGTGAPLEVYPLLKEWLSTRATPWTPAPSLNAG